MADAEDEFLATLDLKNMTGLECEGVVNDDGKTYVTFSVDQRIADARNTTVYTESDDGVSTDVGEDFLMDMITADKPHDNAPYKNNYKGATKSITKKQKKERVLKTFQYNPDDEDMQPGKRLNRKKGEDPDVHDIKKKIKTQNRNKLSAASSRKKKADKMVHLEYMVATMTQANIETHENVKNGQDEIIRLKNVLKTMTEISHNVLEDTNKAQDDAKNGQANILRLEDMLETKTKGFNEEIIRLLNLVNEYKGLHEAYILLNDKCNATDQENKKLSEKLRSALVQ
jgi:hypothetical protein